MLLDSDRIRLRHMLEAAREAVAFVRDKTRSDLTANRQLQHSLVRCIEIIGEAASRLTADFRAAHPDVPWQDMISVHNRLVHAYFDMDLDVVWQTTREELPALIGRVEAFLEGMGVP